jgi:hypothetical protein
MAPSRAAASGSHGSVQFIYGEKEVNGDDWASHDLTVVGVDIMWADDRWPVMIQAYFTTGGEAARQPTALGGGGVANDLEEYSTEVGLGIAGAWRFGRLHPHIGGGVASIGKRVEYYDSFNGDYASDSESAFGGWLAIGALVRIIERLNLGATARWSVAHVGDGYSYSIGGIQYGFALGWAWPSSR